MRWNVIAVLFCILFGCTQQKEGAEVIILNGKIYSVNNHKPWVEALAISNGRIIETGNTKSIERLKRNGTKVIDAKGHFVMPGFIEGHGHLPGLGASLLNLNLLNTTSWDSVIAAVARKVSEAKPGEWIIGRGWHQEKWHTSPLKNVHGYPYHHELSSISPNNPVMLTHASGHALFANKAAMVKAGVTQETGDPQGGHIVRGDGGEAIGIFEENAERIIEAAYQEYLTSLTQEEIIENWYEGIRLAQEECLRKGITSFHDAGSSLEEVERMMKLANKGELDMRVWMMIRHTSEFLEGKLDAYPVIGAGNNFFTCRALKCSIDGALGTYGAWLLEPYEDNPGFVGQNTTSLEELSKLADLCARHKLQLCTHAIGDRANQEVLNLYETKQQEYQLVNPKWRIEHAQHLHPSDITRFGKLGVIAVMQGIHCTSDAPFVEKRLGKERAQNGAYVWRSLLDAGAVIVNGTDTPVEDVDPLASFYATVTRKRADNGMEFYTEQKLSRAEAVYSYTMAPAYAGFEEHIKGSLEEGKHADLVILSNDLINCADNEILKTKVLLTMVNGKLKYVNPAADIASEVID